ncbi:MAG: hypothetical protein ACM3NG_00310 [Candidatus Doudnabacteria bacterium]
MDRVYYEFPRRIDFERRYGFKRDMKYLVRVMASINGKSGSMEFETQGPNVKRNVDMVKARREVKVDVTKNKMDFVTLTPVHTEQELNTIPANGTVDFRVTVMYTYFDKNFDRMPLQSDIFLVRSILNGDLTLQVTSIDGQGRTLPEEIANTIETQLGHFKG